MHNRSGFGGEQNEDGEQFFFADDSVANHDRAMCVRWRTCRRASEFPVSMSVMAFDNHATRFLDLADRCRSASARTVHPRVTGLRVLPNARHTASRCGPLTALIPDVANPS